MYVFVVRAWFVGRNELFTQYIVRTPVEALNGHVVNYFHIPAKTPTQVATEQD